METGWYQMSNDEYHEGPEISRSGLWRILTETPAHFKIPVVPTEAMIFGTAFHCAVLDLETFNKQYVLLPDDCRVGSGKGQRSRKKDFEIQTEAEGRTIIDPTDLEKIYSMREAVDQHLAEHEDRTIQTLLTGGLREISGFWNDPEYPEILCKIRVDNLFAGQHILVDLKKTADANPDHGFFRKVAYDKGYDMQAAWYLYGATQITRIEHKEFYFIAAEDHEPWGVQVYPADDLLVQHGLTRCSRAMTIYRECLETDTWPCYKPEVRPLELPGWVMRKEGYGGIYE